VLIGRPLFLSHKNSNEPLIPQNTKRRYSIMNTRTTTAPTNDHCQDARTNKRRQQIAKSLIHLIRKEFHHLDWDSTKHHTKDRSLPVPLSLSQSLVVAAPKHTLKQEQQVRIVDYLTIDDIRSRNSTVFLRRSSKDDRVWIKEVYKNNGPVCTSVTTFLPDTSKRDDKKFSSKQSPPLFSCDANISNKNSVEYGTDTAIDKPKAPSRQKAISKSLIRLIRKEFGHIDWDSHDDDNASKSQRAVNNNGAVKDVNLSRNVNKKIVKYSTSNLTKQQEISKSVIHVIRKEFDHIDWDSHDDDNASKTRRAVGKEDVTNTHVQGSDDLVNKSERISKAIICLIHAEFDHVDWKRPKRVLPPQRALDWSVGSESKDYAPSQDYDSFREEHVLAQRLDYPHTSSDAAVAYFGRKREGKLPNEEAGALSQGTLQEVHGVP